MGTGAVKQFVLSVTGHSEETQIFLADDKINLSSDVKVTFDGLEADSTYRFQVAAMNDIGIGPFSEMSDEVTTGNISIISILSWVCMQKPYMVQSFDGVTFDELG